MRSERTRTGGRNMGVAFAPLVRFASPGPPSLDAVGACGHHCLVQTGTRLSDGRRQR